MEVELRIVSPGDRWASTPSFTVLLRFNLDHSGLKNDSQHELLAGNSACMSCTSSVHILID